MSEYSGGVVQVERTVRPSIVDLQRKYGFGSVTAKKVYDLIQQVRDAERDRCIKKLLEVVPMCDPELTMEYLKEELAKGA